MHRRLPLLFAAMTPALFAQDLARPHFVRASGEATVLVKPDRAQLSIAVTSTGPSAAEASAHNATQSTAVIEAVRMAIGSAGKVESSGYSIAPQYDYSNGHAPRLTGYQASNAVSVTIDQLPLAGKVIDAATHAGATNVNGISFTLKDNSAVREQALAEAAVKARSNAEAIAKALGVTVVGVLEAEPTESPSIRPMGDGMAMRSMAMAQPATPIEAGDLNVSASVRVTLAVR